MRHNIGDVDMVKKLNENGMPPYEEEVSLKTNSYLSYFNLIMARNPIMNDFNYEFSDYIKAS